MNILLKRKLKNYLNNHLNQENRMIEETSFLEKTLFKGASKEVCYDLHNYIDSKKDISFQTLLFQYIDERNLKDSDVYNEVHIDRRLFSKIRSDENYHPSKETILLLGFSLKLEEDEIEKLLESASYSLPKNNYYDLIIRFCFKEQIHDIKKVNELLESYKCRQFHY